MQQSAAQSSAAAFLVHKAIEIPTNTKAEVMASHQVMPGVATNGGAVDAFADGGHIAGQQCLDSNHS